MAKLGGIEYTHETAGVDDERARAASGWLSPDSSERYLKAVKYFFGI